MGMQHRHVVDAGAASRVSDQIAAPICRYPFDDLRLCQPNERIVYIERATEDVGKQAAKARQNLWMRGSGSTSADDLGNRRQVEADHAIFENSRVISAKEPRSHRSKGGKQKGPGPVCQLLAKIAIESRPYRNMEHAVGAESAIEADRQDPDCALAILDRGPVAYERDLLAVHCESLNGSGK